jgi:ubiquitin carboxyl-terminal hydrolase 25/28
LILSCSRYYAGLGAVGDFSDALLLFAFSCQNRVDEANSPYYFECLQAIAIGRNSEVLDLQVQILASQGYTNRQEVARAYQYIGMDPDRADVVTDENIIGQFRSRISNIGPADAEESRNALRVIAFARKSDKIRQEAANAIENYEQALAWLDLDDHSPDEFVMTMFTIKVRGANPLPHMHIPSETTVGADLR